MHVSFQAGEYNIIEIIQFEEYLGICATGRVQLGYQQFVATKIWQGLKHPKDFQTDQMKRKRRMDSHVLTTEGLYRKIPIAFWFCLGKKGLFSGTPQISIKGDLFFLGSKKNGVTKIASRWNAPAQVKVDFCGSNGW